MQRAAAIHLIVYSKHCCFSPPTPHCRQVLATRCLDLFKKVNGGEKVAPADPLAAILNEMP